MIEFYLALVLNIPEQANLGPPPQHSYHQFESEQACMIARDEFLKAPTTVAAVCMNGRVPDRSIAMWNRLTETERLELILRLLKTLADKK